MCATSTASSGGTASPIFHAGIAGGSPSKRSGCGPSRAAVSLAHEVVAKFGGSRIIMKPASAGTGVKAGGAMRAVFETVGVTDVICKSKGSSNPHNLVKATLKALDEMRSPAIVAHYRGITVDKVFNG